MASPLSTIFSLHHPSQKPLGYSPTLLLRSPISSSSYFVRSSSVNSLRFPRHSVPLRFNYLKVGFALKAATNGRELEGIANDQRSSKENDEELEMRGQSTMPERFRYLTKEVAERPVRWPWAIALVFLIYAWRTVLWELTNWKEAVLGISNFFVYLLKLVLALVFHFIGSPVTSLIWCIEYCLYSARSGYAGIVAFAPVPELTRIIVFTSIILAIAETAVPGSVDGQPYLLSLVGILGFGAVSGFIPELILWSSLFGTFCYSRFFKKRDVVLSALPSTAALVAIGEPWLRSLTICSYLALAIMQYPRTSKKNVAEETNIPLSRKTLPFPLLLAGLAIGINLAAKWLRHRHLTWMIV